MYSTPMVTPTHCIPILILSFLFGSVFQQELDTKHDKYERIVKLSRDITIESKRIIFLLHRISGDSNKDDVMEEACDRISDIQSSLLSKVAEELVSEDMFQFLHAFTAGLQEYIEAVAFYVYVKHGCLVTKRELEEKYLRLRKSPTAKEGEPKSQETEATSSPEDKAPIAKEPEDIQTKPEPISFDIPPLEFILGLADFTGELMRLCINSIGDGDLQLPFDVVDFLRKVYDGFQLVGNQSGRELTRKVRTLRQSLWKVENVCYTLQVRVLDTQAHVTGRYKYERKGDESYGKPEIET
ncbi:putative translin-associated protein X [Apostichopus japonicus]|uniref:Putative translin-associated protein X n=1 Tax=Stichopus japonicus TaxID=307972 RepID=A0A2G8JV75_STIJA|nr:putative translin-associated protein X [Apostichopus japonicus]